MLLMTYILRRVQASKAPPANMKGDSAQWCFAILVEALVPRQEGFVDRLQSFFSRFFKISLNDIECTWRQAIRKESCWTISNITAGNREQIQEAACSAWLHGRLRCLDRLVSESIILKREVYNMQPSRFGLPAMPCSGSEDCGHFSPSIRSSTTACCLQILGRNSASVICACQFGYCMLLMLMASQVYFCWGHPFASDCRFWHQERGALSLSKRYWLQTNHPF